MVYKLNKCTSDYANPPVFHQGKKYSLPDTIDTDWKEQSDVKLGEKIIMPWLDYGFRVDDKDIWRIPKRLIWGKAKRRKIMPLHFHIVGMHIVSETLMKFVEKFDPGVHQFFPVEFFCEKTGEVVDDYEQYYIMNVCTFIGSWDLFDIEQMIHEGKVIRKIITYDDGTPPRTLYSMIASRSELITKVDKFHGNNLASHMGSIHPVSDIYYGGKGSLYCSDAFYKELIKMKYIGFYTYHCRSSVA